MLGKIYRGPFTQIGGSILSQLFECTRTPPETAYGTVSLPLEHRAVSMGRGGYKGNNSAKGDWDNWSSRNDWYTWDSSGEVGRRFWPPSSQSTSAEAATP